MVNCLAVRSSAMDFLLVSFISDVAWFRGCFHLVSVSGLFNVISRCGNRISVIVSHKPAVRLTSHFSFARRGWIVFILDP